MISLFLYFQKLILCIVQAFLLEDKVLGGKKCDPFDMFVVEQPTHWRKKELASHHLQLELSPLNSQAITRGSCVKKSMWESDFF